MHQDVYPPMQPHARESLVEVIAVKLQNLHDDVSGMRDVLKELANAVTKLAVIEERQGQAAQALERAFIALEKVETRLGSLEKSQPLQQQSVDWVNRGMWAAAVAVAYFVAKKVGLI